MALPTNYFVQQQMNDSINPFSATNMINKDLMDQAVKEQRERTNKQFERNSSPLSSTSSKGSNTSHSLTYIEKKNRLFSDFGGRQKSSEAFVNLSSNSGNTRRGFEITTSSSSNFKGRVTNSSTNTNTAKEKSCSLM
ncbi:MAG: hypothetical protein ACRDDW_01780 [Candidatus Rhabdochlamydia sp.]